MLVGGVWARVWASHFLGGNSKPVLPFIMGASGTLGSACRNAKAPFRRLWAVFLRRKYLFSKFTCSLPSVCATLWRVERTVVLFSTGTAEQVQGISAKSKRSFESTYIMGQKGKRGPEPQQILAALLAIGLTGTFGLGAFAIHQQFPGRINFKLKDWVELGYEGRA